MARQSIEIAIRNGDTIAADVLANLNQLVSQEEYRDEYDQHEFITVEVVKAMKK